MIKKFKLSQNDLVFLWALISRGFDPLYTLVTIFYFYPTDFFWVFQKYHFSLGFKNHKRLSKFEMYVDLYNSMYMVKNGRSLGLKLRCAKLPQYFPNRTLISLQ